MERNAGKTISEPIHKKKKRKKQAKHLKGDKIKSREHMTSPCAAVYMRSKASQETEGN